MHGRTNGWAAVAAAVIVSGAEAADRDVGPGQPYATIQEAADDAAAGDTILVHAGEYAEQLTLDGLGAADAPIVLTSAGDGAVTIVGRIRLAGDHWVLSDLALRAGDADGIQVTGSSNRMERLELSGGSRDGIDGAGRDNEVRGCHLHHFDGGDGDAHCIVLNPGATGWRIVDNDIHECSGDGIQLYSAGAERTIVDTLIENNEIYWDGELARSENAVDVKNADGLRIVGNRFRGFVENKTLVFQKAPTNVEVSCNVMSDGSTGVEFRGEDGGVIENVRFVQNLMVGYADYALKFDGVRGAEVYSNTFVDVASDGLRIEEEGLSGGTVRNNLWVRTGALDAGDFDADHNGTWEVSRSDIASATDVDANPLLDGDHHLGAGSPMIDSGLDVDLPFAGDAPDLGAFEVGLETCGDGDGDADGDGDGDADGDGDGDADGDGDGDADADADADRDTDSDADADGDPDGGDPDGDEGGCGCRTSGPGGASVLLAVLASALVYRRSRARRARG